MTERGYDNRLYAVEWHGRLWQVYGTPLALCNEMVEYCGDCVRADYYGVARPEPPENEHILSMQRYLDEVVFSSSIDLVDFA